MKLYLFDNHSGFWYKGCSPMGHVLATDTFEAAAFFTEATVEDAIKELSELGLTLYSVDISEPVMVGENHEQ